MGRRPFLLRLAVVGVIGAGLSRPAAAFDPALTFEKNCSSCHTVGHGDDVGPDLKGVAERRTKDWLVRFVQSSQSVIKGGDPVGNELFNKFRQKKMPDQDLTPDEIGQLMDYIAKGGPAAQPVAIKPANTATPEQIAWGRDLYLGRRRFTNGAIPCISCHSVGDLGPFGGGTLALKLTQAYTKYGDSGLGKSLTRPGFPLMKEIFSAHPLTENEVFALKAFLYEADQSGLENRDYQRKFIFLGVSGTAVLLGVTDLVWRKRRRRSTKPWLDREKNRE